MRRERVAASAVAAAAAIATVAVALAAPAAPARAAGPPDAGVCASERLELDQATRSLDSCRSARRAAADEAASLRGDLAAERAKLAECGSSTDACRNERDRLCAGADDLVE